jgi:murein DD-endopeptidase MepM/ murein hydrolase activator NlpD
MRYITWLIFLVACFGCGSVSKNIPVNPAKDTSRRTFVYDTNYIATAFRNPVGNPPGVGYYDAQPFMRNTHLGEDWNGNGGGNSDLGDTVYACANGYIKFAQDIGGGWGNVVRILHHLPAGYAYKEVESLYAHFDTVLVKANTYVNIGTPIGTIGTAHNMYPAHLHFEMRHAVTMEIGGGYSTDTTGYLNPKVFIKEFNKKSR